MKHGDFSKLVENYLLRPAYSQNVLNAMLRYTCHDNVEDFCAAEVGAGTGKLTKMIADQNLVVDAIEPNDEMRAQGINYTKACPTVSWRKGSGEETGLASSGYHWVAMASSFHWTDPERSLPEFHRILKPGGFLSVLWNPRDIERSKLHMRIERRIEEMIPELKRVSSGAKKHAPDWSETLTGTGHFKDVVFIEGTHEERMTTDRYMGVWRSVNDIRVQAGEERFEAILRAIEKEISGLSEILVPYKTRSWTAARIS